MNRMLIFGLGYSASHLAEKLRADGWQVNATGRAGNLEFTDDAAVKQAIASASHILSSVPPDRHTGADPVLARYGEAIKSAPAHWTGYISSTGVYGDVGGAWVDESAPIGGGRRKDRSDADQAWQDLRDNVTVFRLPGIYGPGRSPLDRVRSGEAKRIDMPQQIFSRIHVSDIAAAIRASFDGPPGVYNIADDLPAPQHEVIAYAATLLGIAVPPLLTLEQADLSPMALGFYAENRRVANGKAKRLLGWQPQYRDYKSGLQSLL